MKKVNFKKLTNQFLAGVFALTLMGGVMLHAQEFSPEPGNGAGGVGVRECNTEIISCGWFSGSRTVCHVNGNGISCNCGDSTKCD